ncbi:MAG TPA: hypothetical protein VFI19_03595 [Nocardioides sp.]|nr:hypothetical protein [Nocardioides sp.]
MTKSKHLKTLAVGAVVAGLMAPPASQGYPAPTRVGRGAVTSPTSPSSAPTQYEHTTKTHRARGTFQCGDLTLRVAQGREIEVQDGLLENGVARLSIRREWRHATLHGSDGRTYRASGVTAAWFVLEDPDFEHPVSGLEVIQVFFRRGPSSSPGWLRETIEIRHGHETDRVNGPCDYAS